MNSQQGIAELTTAPIKKTRASGLFALIVDNLKDYSTKLLTILCVFRLKI